MPSDVTKVCKICGTLLRCDQQAYCSFACRNKGRPYPPVEERFWAKVDRSGGPDACWEWTGSRSPKGYGWFKFGGRARHAHCVAWILTRGEIPNGLDALHDCDNPPCCNPAHLFLGTNADNVADKVAKGRVSRLKGSANGRAKLTSEDVSAIRHAYAEGNISQSALAARYGVDQTQISAVIRLEHWI